MVTGASCTIRCRLVSFEITASMKQNERREQDVNVVDVCRIRP